MAQLLAEAAALGIMPAYGTALLAEFQPEEHPPASFLSSLPHAQPLREPLSQRELEVLQLIAQGLSNSEIGARLFLALSTVKGHSREIFAKLQVQRRTEAVARARELGVLETGIVSHNHRVNPPNPGFKLPNFPLPGTPQQYPQTIL